MGEWFHNPSGDQCPWCEDADTNFEPFDMDDAEMVLCRGHVAEWLGVSLDGLDRMDAAEAADRDALGFNDN
jgi:hypothetical protein